MTTLQLSIDSDQAIADWLLLRTALWRVGKRPLAFEVIGQFRRAGEPQETSLSASLERIDSAVKHLDAFCAAIGPKRGRGRPDPAADDEERRWVHVWLEETQWRKMRAVARGVLHQRYGSAWTHEWIMEDMFQQFRGLRQLDAVLASYDPLRTPLLPYVLVCFRRACLKYVVGLGPRPTDPGDTEVTDDLPGGEPSPEQVVEKKKNAELLWHVAESVLTPINLEVLRLRYQAGLTDKQIGQQVGISRHAAKTRLDRARKQLKAALKAMGAL